MRIRLLVITIALAGCGPSYTQRQQAWRTDLAMGRTAQAERAIDDAYDGRETGGVARVGDSDALIWAMERGSAALAGGDHPAAVRHLDRAARIAEAHRPLALAREVGTYLLNDQLRTYDGWPQEHALIDVLRLLAHLEQAQRADGLDPTGARDAELAWFHYERAVNVGRRLSLTLPRWIREQGWTAYPDEAFGRLLGAAAVFALPSDQRAGSDLPAADAALRAAREAYARQAAAAAQAGWRPAPSPRTLEHLWVRAGDAAEGASARSAIAGHPPAAPPGHGSLLLLDLADYAPQLEQWRFTLLAGHWRAGRDRRGGQARIGSFTFWVEGPGAEAVRHWPLLPWPGELIRPLAPGGIGVLAFEIPAHAPRRADPGPATAELIGPDGAVRRIPLEALADPDALARACLAERQPGIVIKTLARAVAKQVGVGILAHRARKENEALGLVANLLGSLLMSWSEQADLRAWATLPGRIDGALVDLPAGTWTIQVPGAPPRTLTIPAGRLAVAPVRSFRAGVTPLPPPR